MAIKPTPSCYGVAYLTKLDCNPARRDQKQPEQDKHKSYRVTQPLGFCAQCEEGSRQHAAWRAVVKDLHFQPSLFEDLVSFFPG